MGLPPAGHSGDRRRGPSDRRTLMREERRTGDKERRQAGNDRRDDHETARDVADPGVKTDQQFERRTSSTHAAVNAQRTEGGDKSEPVHVTDGERIESNTRAAVTGISDVERLANAKEAGVPTRTTEEGEIKTFEGGKIDNADVGSQVGSGSNATEAEQSENAGRATAEDSIHREAENVAEPAGAQSPSEQPPQSPATAPSPATPPTPAQPETAATES